MELNISLSEKHKDTLFYSCLFIVFSISFLIRLLMYFSIKTFIPSTDVLYHVLLTKMIIVQKTPFIFWEDGSAVNYPIGFHTLSALISVLFQIPSFRSTFALAMTVTGLQTIMAYLIGKEIGNRYIGLASALFFGMGLFPWTPFLYAGMYANIFGQFLAMVILFGIVKHNLNSIRISILCGILLGILTMTHAIALVSFMLFFLSYVITQIALKRRLDYRNVTIFLFCGFMVSLPWLSHIAKNIILGSHSLSEPWEYTLSTSKGLFMTLFIRYKYHLLFVPIGIYAIVKKFKRSAFLLLWIIFLYGMTYTAWGNRFGMEMYIPANFLSSFGLVELVSWSWNRIKRVRADSIILLFVLCFFIVDTIDNSFYQLNAAKTDDVAKSNFEAMEWIKENTKENEIFYASTTSAYIGYIIVYADRDVLNYGIFSSAESSVNPSPERQETLKDLKKMEKPEVFGEDEFYSLLLKNNVTYIYVFNKKGKSVWNYVGTSRSTTIYKTNILDSRKDLYDVIYENEYVKIFKIKKKIA